ncbi:hypothetical protein GCM10007424_01650 [Flavobacterium suaedae]|uniref:TIGR02117 family protein n=1 Tax=Flavobacterium suaedae TaxID=1767027 RepID=A0ABQ1JFV8_9FLAO|nr:TIGR02117 family protein [Flavobacterium suaedae]GGB65387.1 hypothetical protein GCM10007424_01650 [Flavobacterium suaedae]
MAKSRLKKTVRFIKQFILAFIAVITVYILATFIFSIIPVNSNIANQGDITVYINSNGVHTDIVVPVKNNIKDWTTVIPFSHTIANDSLAQYVAFGWGDRAFYLETPQWSDLKASTAFNAAFHLGTSAMHTRFYRTLQEDEECIKLKISKSNYKKLVTYIDNSFAYSESKQVKWIANRSYNNYDAFYEAKGKYSLFYTCNTWTNNALKAANQKAALWTLYDKGILYHYDK